MKQFTLTFLLATSVAMAALGQSVLIDLTENTGDPWTRPGLLYWDGVPLGTSHSPTVNVTLWGGVAPASVTNKLVSLFGVNACWVVFPGAAYDISGMSYTVPGLAPNATGYFEVQWWLFFPTSFEEAVHYYGYASSGIFANPTGGGGPIPNRIPGLVGMPALEFSLPIPFSTIGLVGLGFAALLVFRRR